MTLNIPFDQKLTHQPQHFSNNRVHFFKYVSVKTAQLIIENRSIRFTKPSALNDAFDMQLNFLISPLTNKMIEEIGEIQWKIYKGLINEVENNSLGEKIQLLRNLQPNLSRKTFLANLEAELRDGYSRGNKTAPTIEKEILSQINTSKIFCMTSTPLNKLMWSHYADSNNGVVLRFKSIPLLDSFLGTAKKVKYSETMPEMITSQDLVKIMSGQAIENYEERLDRIVYTKSSIWKYEDEWRVFLAKSKNPDNDYEDKHFQNDELDGVFFGLKTSQNDKDSIIRLAKNFPNILFYQTVKKSGSFELDLEQLSK